MFEQIYKMNGELTANPSRLAVARATQDTTKAGDAIVNMLRAFSDVTFVVLMIVIAVAQPIWVLLLTSFIYS
jgi:hypothetical protein